MAAERATSNAATVKSPEQEEISCPVCLEVFEDPRILPACGHNVCSQCLENMTRRKPSSLMCPVCRSESPLGTDGIKSLTTNVELVRLVEESRGERQREAILKAFETSVQKMADANKILENFDSVIERRRDYGNQVKTQIHDLAEQLTAMILVKEHNICEQVDRETAKHEDALKKQKSAFEGFVANSRVFIAKVEAHLNKNEDECPLEEGKSLLSEARRFTGANLHKKLTSTDVVTAKLSPNLNLLSKLEKEGLGQIYSTNAACDFSSCFLTQGSSLIGESGNSTKNQPPPLEAEITIKASDLDLDSFSPLSLATDGQKYIAVADPANSNVFLLDKKGNLKQKFKPPESSTSSKPVTFSGVAFTKSNELIAVCGSTDVHYLNTQDGSFKMSYKTSDKYGIRYCFITTASDGRLLLTCEPSLRTYNPCIFVYMDVPFGKPDLRFGINGESRLEFPFKAVYHSNEYFVSDMEKGCILVYDCDGTYRRSFGGKNSDSSSELVLPTGLAVCPKSHCLYVCDWGSSSIQIYRPTGGFVALFVIEGRPTDLVLLDNGTVVVSSKDDQWIKFYTLPPFTIG